MATGTRNKLVGAAKELFYQQGVQRTTLANIAEAADVPLGNVYYHFRTKDTLIDAVTEDHAADLRRQFTGYEQIDDPRERLRRFVRNGNSHSETLSRFGCPYGSLCQELERSGDPGSQGAARLMQLHIDWAAEQLGAIGVHDPQGAAEELIVRIQGTYLIAGSIHDADFIRRQAVRTIAWIDSLV